MKPARRVLLFSVLAALATAAIIPLFDATLVPKVALLPDQGASWYYWKLPDPTWITRVSAWLPYLIHQIHGTTVALFTQNSPMWTMFFTGFLTIFIVTQIYGLGLPKWAIRTASVAYLVLTLGLYTFYPSGSFSAERLAQIYQVSFIPVAEYGLVFVVAAALWTVSLLPPVRSRLHPNRQADQA